MTVLLTGASGLLGRAVLETLRSEQIPVIGCSFSRTKGDLIKVDLLDVSQLESCVRQHRPDIIIHCAAERRPDIAFKNPEAVQKLNVESVEHLIRLAQELDAWLLYLSTDYVFDGCNPPYEIDAVVNPLNDYGRSKHAGEQVSRRYHKATVLRVPLLYGPVEFLEESAVTVLLKAIKKEQETIMMDHLAIRYPTHVHDVSRVYELTKRVLHPEQSENIYGRTFHYTGSEPYTKYEMALEMAQLADIPTEKIRPQTLPRIEAVNRPINAHLSMRSLEEIGVLTHCRRFRDAILEIIQAWKE